ncbi:MAG TPA: methyltransferase domain-containing protein [Dehalococcoidia bacterium]|nr:methyltransferase domain-containing protein [Dehalococcoidia bacterium]
MTSTYVFDNAWQQERRRLDALETIWDPWTIRNLAGIGVSEGWRCAEIGAGGGSIARWLATRVGPAGRVLATDLDTRLLDSINEPNLETRLHDITSEDLELASFDLIHARLLLEHLPEHRAALRRMCAALKPGGWLLIEEFDHSTFLPDTGCDPEDVGVWQAWLTAFGTLAQERGLDLTYGSRLFGLLDRLGLDEVAAEGYTVSERGGSEDRGLLFLSVLKLRDALVASGRIDEITFDRLLALLQDRSFVWTSQLMVSARGQRPI